MYTEYSEYRGAKRDMCCPANRMRIHVIKTDQFLPNQESFQWGILVVYRKCETASHLVRMFQKTPFGPFGLIYPTREGRKPKRTKPREEDLRTSRR